VSKTLSRSLEVCEGGFSLSLSLTLVLRLLHLSQLIGALRLVARSAVSPGDVMLTGRGLWGRASAPHGDGDTTPMRWQRYGARYCHAAMHRRRGLRRRGTDEMNPFSSDRVELKGQTSCELPTKTPRCELRGWHV